MGSNILGLKAGKAYPGAGTIEVQNNGAPVAARRNLNFVGADAIADDPGNDAVKITLPSGGGGGSSLTFRGALFGDPNLGTTGSLGPINVPAGTLTQDQVSFLKIVATGYSSGLGAAGFAVTFGPSGGDIRTVAGGTTAGGGDPFWIEIRLVRYTQTSWWSVNRIFKAGQVLQDGGTQMYFGGSEDQFIDFSTDACVVNLAQTSGSLIPVSLEVFSGQ